MNKPTLSQFKAWSKAHKQQAMKVCMAKAFAQCERERVNAYVKPIFEGYGFQYCGEMADKCKLSGPCPQADLYLCEDPRIPAYYEALDAAHRAHGFTGPHGYCPALVAENALMEAERELIEAGTELIGIDSAGLIYGDTREKLLDLLLGACLIRDKQAA